MNEPAKAQSTPVQSGNFEGRVAFSAAIVNAIAWAAEQGCKEMFWLDRNFADWPLSDSAVLGHLRLWAQPGRRLHLLAEQYDDVARRHPRFVQWRGRYGHCVHARAWDEPGLPPGSRHQALLIIKGAAGHVGLRLFDHGHWRGHISLDKAEVQALSEEFDASLQRSYESFAATTLGL